MREDLRSQNLTFTEIAKLVGENWQNLNANEKEAYESQANADKEKYHRDLMEYKKTADYRKYMQYLHEFKEKQAKRTQADSSKRTKLDPVRLRHSSSSSSTMTPGNTSSGSGSERLQGSEPPPCRRERLNSIASVAESQHSSTTPTLLSQANSNDDTMSSPRGNNFDAGSPREFNHQPSTRQQAWREGVRGSDVSQQQHLPSLSNMLEDGRKGMPVSSGSEGNPYSSGFVAANHPRSVPEVPNVLPSAPPKVPLLRHEPSSTSSVGSISPAASYARTPGEGPLPIHALLSHHQTLPTPIAAANASMFERGSLASGFGTTTPSPTDPTPLTRPPFSHGVVPRGYGT
ncbi:unnamed protein product [Fusarium equiseti]|uniref:HMG box domain-containing protein n=1 Tax=Fusarium equiseti TaxID=61235 RepID=A0A8J2IEV9_FUSEQ|nr:unnamed protein product [Fusarium equiseti]